MKKILCKYCKATGEVLIKKGQWKGCLTSCGECCGTGSIYYVSTEQFYEIKAGRLKSSDIV